MAPRKSGLDVVTCEVRSSSMIYKEDYKKVDGDAHTSVMLCFKAKACIVFLLAALVPRVAESYSRGVLTRG